MAPQNPYKSINIDRKKMQQAVEAIGAEDYSYGKVGNTFQMVMSINGSKFGLTVYENSDGTTTLTKMGSYSADVFEQVAEQIKTHCSTGNGGSFQISIPKFPGDHAENLLKYLNSEGEIDIQKNEHGYLLTRLKGHQGDVLTVKQYENGTIQLQGRWAMLAACAQDFLSTVLPYNEAVKAQLDTFSVPVSVQEVRNELEGRLPFSAAKLDSVVAAQLTSALVMIKVDLNLPDYGAVAFPALRGLEGFIKTELWNAGFQPNKANTLGEYFTQGKTVGAYAMHDAVAAKAGEPLCSLLVDCYTLYANQRHGIAHMEADPQTSRVITSLAEAKTIVNQVFDIIERFYCKLTK
ncbi:MAG: type II toxin-antitoxin system RnlA family toxin [Ferribacterium limneticum]